MSTKISNDLNKLANSLDISVEMFNTAKSNYEYISDIFIENGIEADFYPQGSFRLGTVVRPNVRGQNKAYDLDIIVEIKQNKNDVEPKTTKMIFKQIIDKYSDLRVHLQPEENRCWTLSYPAEDFEFDIVPAVQESSDVVNKLVTLGIPFQYVENAIAITDKIQDATYVWAKSNPKGYAFWFDEINEPYRLACLKNHNFGVLNEGVLKHFSTIEEIPPILQRSSLQRVIQILKLHRDMYFTNLAKQDKKMWDFRPSSVIITTLCAKIAAETEPTDNLYELISRIAKELSEYSELKTQRNSILFESVRMSEFKKKTFLRKTEDKWSLKNPVNPEDDYTDCWTSEHAEYFFKWINAVISEFENIHKTIPLNEANYFSALEASFGRDTIRHAFPQTKEVKSSTTIITNPTQPYGVLR